MNNQAEKEKRGKAITMLNLVINMLETPSTDLNDIKNGIEKALKILQGG